MKYNVSTVEGACGVGVILGFKDQSDLYEKDFDTLKHGLISDGGTGFTIVAFINTNSCKEFYEYIHQNYPIVYQSPLRVNKNSQHHFFFIVVDCSQNPLGFGWNATDPIRGY